MRGERYADCTLDSFDVASDAQQRVVGQLRDFIDDLRANILDGRGLILYGPRGTGKDHLLFAAMRRAVELGLTPMPLDCDTEPRDTLAWRNGVDLIGDFRAQIGERGESDFYAAMAAHRVLAISDPLPPSGSLTEFQAAGMFRVIDARYSRRRPTWLTINVASRRELDDRLGAQTADRLIDGSLTLHCSWDSYRQSGGRRR